MRPSEEMTSKYSPTSRLQVAIQNTKLQGTKPKELSHVIQGNYQKSQMLPLNIRSNVTCVVKEKPLLCYQKVYWLLTVD